MSNNRVPSLGRNPKFHNHPNANKTPFNGFGPPTVGSHVSTHSTHSNNYTPTATPQTKYEHHQAPPGVHSDTSTSMRQSEHVRDDEETDLLTPGTVVDGRYGVVRLLGRGRFSQTYLVVDKNGVEFENMALKVYYRQYAPIAGREIQVLGTVQAVDTNGYSRIIQLKGVTEDCIGLLLPVLSPYPLIVKDAEPLTRTHYIRKITVQLCTALTVLGDCNVVHADIKPDNILTDLCDPRIGGLGMSVRLCDFGNAVWDREDDLTDYYQDFEIQSLSYRAPEVVYGLPFNKAIDMWSLGCLLVELFRGQVLFRARSRSDLAIEMAGLLSPPPKYYQRGKNYQSYVEKSNVFDMAHNNTALSSKLRDLMPDADSAFLDLVAGLLQYDIHARLTPRQCLMHDFLQPIFPYQLMTKVNIPPSTSLSPAQRLSRTPSPVTDDVPPAMHSSYQFYSSDIPAHNQSHAQSHLQSYAFARSSLPVVESPRLPSVGRGSVTGHESKTFIPTSPRHEQLQRTQRMLETLEQRYASQNGDNEDDGSDSGERTNVDTKTRTSIHEQMARPAQNRLKTRQIIRHSFEPYEKPLTGSKINQKCMHDQDSSTLIQKSDDESDTGSFAKQTNMNDKSKPLAAPSLSQINRSIPFLQAHNDTRGKRLRRNVKGLNSNSPRVLHQ
eukprot:CFRG2121T1